MNFKSMGSKTRVVLVLGAALAAGAFFLSRPAPPKPVDPTSAPATKAALTVSLVTPQVADWPQVLPANGNVVAWQEAVISPEISNYRISEVRVQVGDRVEKGQILARIASDTLAIELAEMQAAVAELQAAVSEAQANAGRAKELQAQGFYSRQLNTQYQTAEQAAQARLAAARARQQAAELKMSKTEVRAPDAGVISARSATVGSLTESGQELFRLIRGGRLEWRAEVPAADLAQLKTGQLAILVEPGGEIVKGTVRVVAPSVDPQTRNGLVYVDLPAHAGLRAGMFARGEFELAQQPAWTLPQTAILLREGFAYVFRLEAGNKVAQTKVTLGRRLGERVEVTGGLTAPVRVVENGAGFLADGDVVKVVDGSAQP